MFRHAPLDQTANSIRLLEILPRESTHGLVRCTMYHSEMDAAKYRCLSYQWGPESTGGIILINGDPYFVRRNLLHFLQRARQKYHSEALWIDAVCIDQNNDSERNHQVQLMGSIYAKALEVYIWLGDTTTASIGETVRANWDDPPLAAVMDSPSFEKVEAVASTSEAADPPQWPNFEEQETIEASDYEDHSPSPLYGIELNSLWDRAWVTQEVALARRIRLIRRSYEMDNDAIAAQDPYGTFGRIPVFNKAQRLLPRAASLLSLLCRFQQHKCSVQRDLIFSLHALCIEGPNIDVDYAMPEDKLLQHVLKACSARLCLCSAAIVATALDTQQAPDCLVTIRTPRSSLSFFRTIEFGLGRRHVCADCKWDMMDWFKPQGHLICLNSLCPGLDIHFLIEPRNLREETSKFHVLGPTHRQTDYVAHVSGSLDPSPDAPYDDITLQMPLQVTVDFDYSRGILYYDEEHLNQLKDTVSFSKPRIGHFEGPIILVEEV